MLIRHSLIYLISRLIPSLIGFIAIIIYTRLLSPTQYGNYALFITSVNLFNILFFQWLRVGLLRHMAGIEKDKLESFKKTLLFGYLFTSVLLIFITPLTGLIFNNWYLVLLVILNSIMLGWFELNQTLFRSLLLPHKYGIITFNKVFLSFIISCIFIYLGFKEYGIFLGILIGTILALVSVSIKHWKVIKAPFDPKLLRKLLLYGLPLTLTFSMTFIIQFSDRYLIGWLRGADQAGFYAVAADLSNQTIAMLMMVINLGALPIAIQKYEQDSKEEALLQFEKNFILMLGIALPIVVGGGLLSKNISNIFFSGEYALNVSNLFPLLLIGTFFSGLKAYYFDQAFQLGNKTKIQIIPVVIAALLSLGLNFILIPQYGAMGAAISSIIAYLVSLILTWWLGRKIIKLPMPIKESFKIIISSLLMSCSIFPFRNNESLSSLLISLTVGILIYLVCIISLNILGLRSLFINKISSFLLREKISKHKDVN